jgi:hypothetical protein
MFLEILQFSGEIPDFPPTTLENLREKQKTKILDLLSSYTIFWVLNLCQQLADRLSAPNRFLLFVPSCFVFGSCSFFILFLLVPLCRYSFHLVPFLVLVLFLLFVPSCSFVICSFLCLFSFLFLMSLCPCSCSLVRPLRALSLTLPLRALSAPSPLQDPEGAA